MADAGAWFDDGKKDDDEDEDSSRQRQERREKAWQLEDEKRESEVKRKESGEFRGLSVMRCARRFCFVQGTSIARHSFH